MAVDEINNGQKDDLNVPQKNERLSKPSPIVKSFLDAGFEQLDFENTDVTVFALKTEDGKFVMGYHTRLLKIDTMNQIVTRCVEYLRKEGIGEKEQVPFISSYKQLDPGVNLSLGFKMGKEIISSFYPIFQITTDFMGKAIALTTAGALGIGSNVLNMNKKEEDKINAELIEVSNVSEAIKILKAREG